MSLLSYIEDKKPQILPENAPANTVAFASPQNTRDILQQTNTLNTISPDKFSADQLDRAQAALEKAPPEVVRELIADIANVETDVQSPQFEVLFGTDGPAVQFILQNLALQGAGGSFVTAQSSTYASLDQNEQQKREQRLRDTLIGGILFPLEIEEFFNQNQNMFDAAAASILGTDDIAEQAKLRAQLHQDLFDKMRENPEFAKYTDEQLHDMIDEKFAQSLAQQLQQQNPELSAAQARAQADAMIQKMDEHAANDPAFAQTYNQYKNNSVAALYDQETAISTWVAELPTEQREIMEGVQSFRKDFVAVLALGEARLVYEEIENPGVYYVKDDDGNNVYIDDLDPEYKDQAYIDIDRQLGQMFANQDPEGAAYALESYASYNQDEALQTQYVELADGLYDKYSSQYDLANQLTFLQNELASLENIIADENTSEEASDEAFDRYLEIQDQIDESLSSNQDENGSLTLDAPHPATMEQEQQVINRARAYAAEQRSLGNTQTTSNDVTDATRPLSEKEQALAEKAVEQEGLAIEEPFNPNQYQSAADDYVPIEKPAATNTQTPAPAADTGLKSDSEFDKQFAENKHMLTEQEDPSANNDLNIDMDAFSPTANTGSPSSPGMMS
ncbi:MAG: hypothetical protein H6860_01685 [Rhodospirillales bacterium]|nr:hypothetical protein [Alphaproteobacteria bacterium]MCB9981091.1 hypothetical protein [Rhodospirillales bacterium]